AHGTGLLTETPSSSGAAPVVTSINPTLLDGAPFGQTVPGKTLATAVPAVQVLAGLSDDSQRLSYFGITNPNPAQATYRVTFFDAAGHQLAASATLTLAPFGQKQFQQAEIRNTYHVTGSDYRVRIETLSGGPLYPYGSVIRVATD